MSDRIATLRRLAASHDVNGLLIAHPPALRWSVGFSGSNGLLLVTETTAHFVTDGRYTTQAAAEVAGAEVHVADGPLAAWAAERGLIGNAGRMGLQAEHVTLADHTSFREAFSELDFCPVRDLLSEAVAAKTEVEIEAVRQAQALTCEVFAAIVPLLAPGISEQEIAAEIVYQHLKRGASAMAFEPIVAAGPRGALPHARPSSRTLAPGDLVVIDMGGVLDGYCSDLTRTVAIGDPDEVAVAAYETVRRAQESAIEAARAGMTGRALDAVARGVIEADGLGEYFSHSLGHGVGIEVHEWPRLSQQVAHSLPAGATVTVEPGVYLPERFGIRIEDVIVLREGGRENLTPLPTDLLTL